MSVHVEVTVICDTCGEVSVHAGSDADRAIFSLTAKGWVDADDDVQFCSKGCLVEWEATHGE